MQYIRDYYAAYEHTIQLVHARLTMHHIRLVIKVLYLILVVWTLQLYTGFHDSVWYTTNKTASVFTQELIN